MTTGRRILRKTSRIFLWLIVSILSLLLFAYIFISLPVGKRVIRNQVTSFLEKKLKTKVLIGSLDFSLPQWLELKNVYLEDQKKDTLLYGGELRVDLNMLKLLKGNTDIEKIYLNNIIIHVNRPETDSVFNYQFIIDAFAGNNPSTQNKDTAALKLTMGRLLVDTIALSFIDAYAGSEFIAAIRNLDLKMKNFQPDRMNFQIDELEATGVNYAMKTLKPKVVVSDADAVAVDTVQQIAYPLYVSGNRIALHDVNVVADDQVTGMYYGNKINSIGLRNAVFSIGESIGRADELYLDSSQISFRTAKVDSSLVVRDTTVAQALPWIFEAGQLRVTDTDIKFDDVNKPLAGGLDFAHLNITDLKTGIRGFHFWTDSTTAVVDQLTFFDSSGFRLDSTRFNLVFTNKKLSVGDLYIKTPNSQISRSVLLTYDSLQALTNPAGNGAVEVKLANTVIAFNDLFLLAPALKKSMGGFANQSVSINTEMHGDLKRLVIPLFELRIANSRLNARGTLFNLNDPDRFAYDIFILQGNFLKRDLAAFLPPENLASLQQMPPQLNISGRFVGNKNDLTADLKASGQDFALAGVFTLKNLSDPTKLSYDAKFSQLSLDKRFITGFLPPAALENISLPQKISAVGKFAGNTNNVDVDLSVQSSYGPLKLKGFMHNLKDSINAEYDLSLNTPGFALGTLLKMDTVLGNLSGNFVAKGKGFDYKTMRSRIEADIASLEYNKYNYRNTVLRAEFDNGNVKSNGSIDDEALKLNYTATANVKGEYPVVNAAIRVDTAQLKVLGFSPDTLNLSLTAKIDSRNLKPRNLDASLILDSIRLQKDQEFFRFDTVSVIASSAGGVDSIVVRSALADIDAGGAFDYDKIAFSIQEYVNGYYKLPGYQAPAMQIPEQQFGIRGTLKYTPALSALAPALSSFENISFTGKYASADTDSALAFNAEIPRLIYGGNSIGNGIIDINSRNNRLNYNVSFDTLSTATNTLFRTSLQGGAANDSISVTARTQDRNKRDWFALSGTAAVSGETYSFRMQDSLKLNYQDWSVANDNYISYSPDGIVVNNLLLKSDTSSISVRSQQLVANSPIDIVVDNFDLRSITSLINPDTLFIGGIVDIRANVSELDKELPGFTGTATVSRLEFMGNLLGDLTATGQKVSDNEIAANIELTGAGNDITAKGAYFPAAADNQFNADLSLKRLNFKTIEGLSQGQLRNSSGSISGDFTADGNFAAPRWKGQLNFDTTVFTLAQVGTPYKIDKQKIVFENPYIRFPEFTILDSLNTPLKIDGDISLRSMEDVGLNVDINTYDFIFVNARKAIASQLFGYAAADVNVSITGTGVKPQIEGDISVNDKSDLTIVLPQAGYEKNDGKTIIRFIDQDTFQMNPPVPDFEEAKKAPSAFGQFLNYNLNIEIGKAAALSIILDPSTGDEIKVQGDANLNAGVDPGGNLILAGSYELDNGYYDLHYQFLNRKFLLQKGSTITFAGAPLDAIANITAVYIANTNSRDLLSNEVSDVSPALANSFNQKLPFQVVLKLSGPLNKPDITFDIELPEENSKLLSADLRTTIENKLQQIRSDPASVNKQVFSLLLLGRFVGEQSSDFFKGNGGGFSSLARQSVSQFLSAALNQIAGDIFKGIDIDLNLNSYNDFSSGGNTERTDLNIAVSKNFANDRLTVSVGQNFGVQGQDAASKASGQNSGFKPDLTLTYKLTKDGKYLLRAYTKNQFEVTVDGYVMETGLAFVLTMDYEKFNELFRRKKKR